MISWADGRICGHSMIDRIAKRLFRRPTVVEALVAVTVISAISGLLFSSVQWASSGSIRFPVRVLVFDATTGLPLADAHVAVFRAPPVLGSKSLEESPHRYDPRNLDRVARVWRGVTAGDGTVVIMCELSTGASNRRPAPYAHVRSAWVHAQADGFGGVVVPVRHESISTATMREMQELFVPVGLTPTEK
jgi:hypothetical protein